MRPATACYECRIHRRRCRPAESDSACFRCTSLGLKCSLRRVLSQRVPQGRHKAQLLPREHVDDDLAGAAKGQGNSDLEDQNDLRTDLVSQYFNHIHDKHHSLFHRPSIESAIRDGTIPKVLILAMMALGARFSVADAFHAVRPRHRGQAFAEKAARLLDMSDISITTIQACILLGTIAFAQSNIEQEALYYAVSTRLALILDLAHRPAADEIERQVNLRVWWTLYMIDIWSSTGLQLPRQLGYSHQVALPLEESQFLQLGTTAPISSVASLWGEMAALAHIWAEIHELHKASVVGHMMPIELNSQVATLSAKLQNWSAALVPHLVCTEDNLTRYASLDLGSAFAALHLGYHYYSYYSPMAPASSLLTMYGSEVLFYQFLSPAAHHPSISRTYYANSCKSHARQFCDLLYLCNRIPNCEPLYIMVGHMLVVTSTIYLHELLFSNQDAEINTARSRLEHNFAILTRLQSYWVELDVSLKRLMAFHNACRISSEQSFRLDRWMLSFLLEHGVPVTEKFVVRESAEEEQDLMGMQRTVPQATIPGDGWVEAHDIGLDFENEAVSDTSKSPNVTVQDWWQRTFVQP